VYRVVLEHVCHVLGINERVIDANNLGLGIVQSGTKDQPPDPTESINPNRRRHDFLLFSTVPIQGRLPLNERRQLNRDTRF
jgi:hypothetical protein